ncbi:MAG: hypothetical protein LIP05_09970 [Tannerellaceae bacterium]|nr:hypothetical protein [Tannerellaceae bacterium]
MHTHLQNFRSLFKKFRMATFLNVVGLSIAFTAFIVMLMQVSMSMDLIVSMLIPNVYSGLIW